MSDYGNRPPDEPTRAYTPVGGGDEDDATRLERPITPYSDDRGDVPPTPLPPGYRGERPSMAAPLVAVGLICTLLGIGLGYLLFHDTSSTDNDPATSTSSTALTTTTTEATTSSTTSTTEKPTTTTAKPTTTTTQRTTTTAPKTTTTPTVTVPDTDPE
jgi:hypothetical protein